LSLAASEEPPHAHLRGAPASSERRFTPDSWSCRSRRQNWHEIRRILISFLATALFGCALGAESVKNADLRLMAPLTTMFEAFRLERSAGATLEATITVPPDAPEDLGVGVFVRTRDGRWFQRTYPRTLSPGRHRVSFGLTATDPLDPKAHAAAWSPAQAALAHDCGLYFWSNRASRATIAIAAELKRSKPKAAIGRFRIDDLSGSAHARTGERWELHLRPDPFPANPFSLDEFQLDAVVTRPDGVQEKIPGFASLPMSRQDRGDSEIVIPTGPDRFTVRYRPRLPGTHRLSLQARWGDRELRCEMPPLVVEGAAWDGYVRVDQSDSRFF
jgi:hypothetical protein